MTTDSQKQHVLPINFPQMVTLKLFNRRNIALQDIIIGTIAGQKTAFGSLAYFNMRQNIRPDSETNIRRYWCERVVCVWTTFLGYLRIEIHVLTRSTKMRNIYKNEKPNSSISLSRVSKKIDHIFESTVPNHISHEKKIWIVIMIAVNITTILTITQSCWMLVGVTD